MPKISAFISDTTETTEVTFRKKKKKETFHIDAQRKRKKNKTPSKNMKPWLQMRYRIRNCNDTASFAPVVLNWPLLKIENRGSFILIGSDVDSVDIVERRLFLTSRIREPANRPIALNENLLSQDTILGGGS